MLRLTIRFLPCLFAIRLLGVFTPVSGALTGREHGTALVGTGSAGRWPASPGARA